MEIRATKNLFNRGKCFTKGKTYQIRRDVKNTYELFDCMTTNDMDEVHIIGTWWKYFELVKQ